MSLVHYIYSYPTTYNGVIFNFKCCQTTINFSVLLLTAAVETNGPEFVANKKRVVSFGPSSGAQHDLSPAWESTRRSNEERWRRQPVALTRRWDRFPGQSGGEPASTCACAPVCLRVLLQLGYYPPPPTSPPSSSVSDD